MPQLLIPATTAAVTSELFRVVAGESPRAIRSWGLAGSETITVQADRGDGTFEAEPGTASVLTATEPKTTILATGTYRLVKTVTAGASGVSRD